MILINIHVKNPLGSHVFAASNIDVINIVEHF